MPDYLDLIEGMHLHVIQTYEKDAIIMPYRSQSGTTLVSGEEYMPCLFAKAGSEDL